ncbi:hypothetical protein LTR56_026073 [Elasticomyces elasticus]|nr:hypothetical protein LTR56_026073 [Elasticomyces elasticus]KAK5748174.1 hypothetical protein LTS12_021774 [Elasticomyces elasticus]
MECTIGAGLTWAVPVRPDELGDRLDRYTKALPQLHTLRLCHRFGGPDAGITALPIELEQAIEDSLVHSARPTEGRYQLLASRGEQFACFQSRCAPLDHLEDCNSSLSDAASDEIQPCEGCEEDWYNDTCKKLCTEDTVDKCMHCTRRLNFEKCLNSCRSKKTHLMNEYAMNSQDWYGVHRETQSQWYDRINKDDKDGGFYEHARTLAKHLGLGVVFHETRIGVSDSDKAAWPKSAKYEWHDSDDLKTTLCYLTLPDYNAAPRSYVTTEMEDECGYVHVAAARAIAVPIPSPTKILKIQARFQRALRILTLRPYVHPAMGHKVKKIQKNEDEAIEDETKKPVQPSGFAWYEAKSKWPRMMVLIGTNFDT